MVRFALCVLASLFCSLLASSQSYLTVRPDSALGTGPQANAVFGHNRDASHGPAVPLTLPLAFEVNRGQAPRDVDFVAQGGGYGAQLQSDSVILNLSLNESSSDRARATEPAVVRIALSGGNRSARAVGENKLPGISNYLFGSDPARWITGVEHYAKVRYRNVYPGIDLLFHGSQGRLEQDFVVRPGANPKRIHLYFQGVQHVELTSEGALALWSGDAQVRIEALRAYQTVQGREVEIPVRYELRSGQATFRLGNYDRRRALIIDPVLVFATFFGGGPVPIVPNLSSTWVKQYVASMAVDASGIYVTGPTYSTSFPVTSGVVEPNFAAPCCENYPQSTFVSKLDPTGQSLIFSTYMAGFAGATLAVDSSQNIYLAGVATTGLPIPSGSQPFEDTIRGGQNLAILKLNSTGTAVLAATYLGGSSVDYFAGLAVDSSENVYVTGTTLSNDFPVQNALQGSLGTSGYNAFVTKLNPTLSGLVYSTYLGADSLVSVPEVGETIALDSSGDAYVIGAAGVGFPTTSSAYQPTCSGTSSGTPCVFFAKVNADDSALLYATYLGTNDNALATALAVDSAEDAYIGGWAYSASFPVVNPIQSCSAIGGSGSNNPSGNFLSEFNAAGALTFSTCLGINLYSDTFGGFIYATGPALTLDTAGNVYLGASSQSGLPLKNPIDANEPALARPFVSEISADTHTLLFSSFVAGPVTASGSPFAVGGDSINAIAVDSSGDLYLAGGSTAGATSVPGYSYFPVFNPMQPYFVNDNPGCPDNYYCTFTDGFIMKVSPSAGGAAASVPGELQFPPTDVGSTSAPLGTTIYDLGTDALTVSNVAASGDFAVQSNNCGTVPASGGSCTIQVAFTPTAMGTQNGTLTITDSSSGSPHKVILTGLGSTANLTVSPTHLTFASQLVGTTSPQQTVTVTANTAAIQSLHLQASGAFAESNDCTTSIAAFASCQVLVTFTPAIAGPASGSITITDSAPNSPQTVSLTGTGQAPGVGLGIAPGSPGSSTVTAGGTAQYSLAIGGAGMSGTASLSCSGAPSGASCTVPATEAVSATTAVPFNVSVSTTAPSAGALIPAGSRTLPWLWAVGLLGLVIVGGNGNVGFSLRRYVGLLPWLLLVLVCSCGGGGGSTGSGSSGGTPAGTYAVKVTATLNGVNESIPLTLKVQ